MFNWFKRQEETPAVVNQAIHLEHGIRDQLPLAEAEKAYGELADLTRSNPQHPAPAGQRGIEPPQTAPGWLHGRRQGACRGGEALGRPASNRGHLKGLPGTPELGVHGGLPPDRLEESAALHTRKLELHASHTELRQHADPVIRTMMKLMTDHLIVGDIAAAQQLYDAITAFANQHPDDREVQVVRCMSAHNLIHRLVSVEDMGPEELALARGYHDGLAEFAAQSPFQEDVAEYISATAELVGEEWEER